LDRARRRSRFLIAAAGFALVLGAARAEISAPPLRAVRWLAPGADAAGILTRRPLECLKVPADPEAAYLVEVGRAAFRDPLLLGGQAARAGVACETCHRNGRTNPDFDFPGVSGSPGTADVTSFVFSSHRGDHTFDPRPIPDLGGPKAALKVSQAPDSPALKTFIRGLITEEFDGAPPPETVLDALAAYVRAMSPSACLGSGLEPQTAGDAIADVRRAAVAAQGALARHDPETARVMIQAARAGLGNLAERYEGPALEPERRRLADAALDLARIAGPDTSPRLAVWIARSSDWEAPILNHEAGSLYNPLRLAAALRRGRG
jgi:hypothetical protein